ncbi:MAG: NnrS family protein [Zoogloea sp.]|nr:NnrS family protein [Zoogloea sp.]
MLVVAPHRAMFFSGVLQLLLWFAWWTAELAARAGAFGATQWPWPAGWLHGFAVIYGVCGFFVFGFLLTAMPRWQGLGDLAAGRFAGPWRMLLAGWLVFDAGLLLPALQAPGLVLVLAGWVQLLLLLRKVAFSKADERLHPVMAWLALAMGAAGILAALVFVVEGSPAWMRLALDGGVWCFLLPVFMTVAHRMVPFFASSVVPRYQMVRPAWALLLLVAAAMAHAALAVAGWQELSWLVDGPAAVVAAWLVWRWQFWRGWSVPLMAMLQVGCLWLPLALGLFAAQSLAAFFGVHVLGLAPLHALAVGFFGLMLLAMVTRVTLGHSGRPLKADGLVWAMTWLLQLVAMLRMAAELSPEFSSVLLVLAAGGWLAIFGAWAVRHLPIYLKPRADGRPG